MSQRELEESKPAVSASSSKVQKAFAPVVNTTSQCAATNTTTTSTNTNNTQTGSSSSSSSSEKAVQTTQTAKRQRESPLSGEGSNHRAQNPYLKSPKRRKLNTTALLLAGTKDNPISLDSDSE